MEPLNAPTLSALLRAQADIAFPRASLRELVTLTRAPYSYVTLRTYLHGDVRPGIATLRDLLGRLHAPAPVVERAIELWNAAEMGAT